MINERMTGISIVVAMGATILINIYGNLAVAFCVGVTAPIVASEGYRLMEAVIRGYRERRGKRVSRKHVI